MAKTDLLTGDVRVLTLKIAAPSVAAMLAASVCPLLEALVLSARDASLSAAVGASLALILLEQTVGFTLGMGAGSFVSRCIGQGRREAARRAASTAFFAALGLSALLLAAGLLFAAPVLRLLGAPESAVAAFRFCACSARRKAPSPPVCLMRAPSSSAGRRCAARWC